MDPIKVGIIGFGRSGCGIHANAITHIPEQFTVSAICDLLPERRSHEKFPLAKPCASADEVISDPAVELVVVASYNCTHAVLAEKALLAGKHVLCEKPFGYTTADVDAMIAASKKAGRILQPFQQRRFEEDFQKVREICRSGILGDLTYIRIFWPGFARRWDWQTSRRYGGGQLYNNGPHLIDHAMELFGNREPEKVTARFRNALSSGDAEDEFDVLLQAAGAPDVEIVISATCAYPQDRWLVCGKAGTLHGNGQKLEWKYVDWSRHEKRPLDLHPLEGRRYCSEKLDWQTGVWEAAQTTDAGAGAAPAPKPVLKLYDSLYRAIRLGEPQLITPEQVRKRIAVMEQCYRQNDIPFPRESRS